MFSSLSNVEDTEIVPVQSSKNQDKKNNKDDHIPKTVKPRDVQFGDCIQLKLDCKEKWEYLTPIEGYETVKLCTVCNENVYRVKTLEEAKFYANAKKCIMYNASALVQDIEELDKSVDHIHPSEEEGYFVKGEVEEVFLYDIYPKADDDFSSSDKIDK